MEYLKSFHMTRVSSLLNNFEKWAQIVAWSFGQKNDNSIYILTYFIYLLNFEQRQN